MNKRYDINSCLLKHRSKSDDQSDDQKRGKQDHDDHQKKTAQQFQAGQPQGILPAYGQFLIDALVGFSSIVYYAAFVIPIMIVEIFQSDFHRQLV